MKFRLFAAIAALMLFVFGFSSANVYANTDNGVQIPPAEEIQQMLTDMLPAFEDFYGYDLVTDLNRAGLNLADFALHLYNYLIFLYEADILTEQDFSTYGPDWLFYFVDGIVMLMSESPATAWGNLSLKGLVLNNIYVNALGLDFLGAFFSHHSIVFLAENLDIAAYFDFLMRDSSIAAVIPFGAATRAYLAYGETDGLDAIIGMENVAAIGQMGRDMRLDFLAGLLMDRMAANLDEVIEEYAGFIVIPSPDMVVSVNVSQSYEERLHLLAFPQDIAFEITTDLGDIPLDIFINNTGDADLIITLQTYDAEGNWHIFLSDFVPAGLSMMQVLHSHEDLASFFRLTIYSADGETISGEFEIGI